MKAQQTSEKPTKIGRPRTIDSPETFDRLVDNYVSMCQFMLDENDNLVPRMPPEPILFTGMVMALGLNCKQDFYMYCKYEEFSESVKRARLFVEHAYERRLVTAQNPAAAIFALKNMGWTDNSNIPPELISPDETEAIERPKLTREEWLAAHGLTVNTIIQEKA